MRRLTAISFFYGGEGEINGDVTGAIFGSSENLRVDGSVGGGIDVTVARSLVLGERAEVAGDVSYSSPSELVRAQNAVVMGEIVRGVSTSEGVSFEDLAIPMLMYAFASLVVYALLRARLIGLVQLVQTSFTKQGLIGIGAMFFLPFVIALLFVTVIGAIMGFLAMLLFLSLYLVTALLIGICIGGLIEQLVKKEITLALPWVLLGIVIVEVALLIPFIGPLALFVFFLVVLGALLYSLYRFMIAP